MSNVTRRVVPGKTSRAIVATAFILMVIVAVFAATTVTHLRELHDWSLTLDGEQQRLAKAREEVAKWEERRRVLDTSDFEKEKLMRELMMVKPDEKMIILKPTVEQGDRR